METIELKTVWSEVLERCYSLHRIHGKTIRIRGVFGRHLVAEIFSPTLLQWQLMAMTTERILEHSVECVNQATIELLDEIKLILGDNV